MIQVNRLGGDYFPQAYRGLDEILRVVIGGSWG